MYDKNFIIDTVNNINFLYHIDSKKFFILDNLSLKKYTVGNSINSEMIYKENQNLIIKTTKMDDKFSTFLDTKTIKKLVLITTNSCNLKCIYCYANGGSYNKKIEFMSESIITKLFSFLKRNKIIINELQFLGGEPLIASNQIETVFNLLEKLEVYPLNISMVTNFTYLPEHIVDLLIKWKVYITVSIDGEKQINDLLRKSHDGSSTYELVKKNIASFRERGGVISCAEATYTKIHQNSGISKLRVIKAIQKDFKIEDIVINDAIDSNRSYNKELYLDKNSTENFIDKDHLHPDDLFFLQKILFIQKKQSHICSAGFQMLTVFPNGDIYPCQLLHKDSYKIGNIETLDKDIKNYIYCL